MNGFEAYGKHVNPVLAQLEDMAGVNRRFVRARGCRLEDEQGREYLDFLSGHGAFNLSNNGFITQLCGHDWNVLKIEPPLTIERADIDRFIEAMVAAVEWAASIS